MADKNKTPEDDIAAELLLKDADDALRQDQLKALWDEWGSTIIGVALMIIFGTMIGTGWQSWRHNIHTSQTSALINNAPDISGSYQGIDAMIKAGATAQVNTPSMMYDLMNTAAESGLPREWDILAEWGKLRALTDIEGNDKNQIADDMIKLSKKRGNPYAAALLMEAAILKGNNGESLSLLNQALEDEKISAVPQLKSQIETLIHLYETDRGAS